MHGKKRYWQKYLALFLEQISCVIRLVAWKKKILAEISKKKRKTERVQLIFFMIRKIGIDSTDQNYHFAIDFLLV